VNANQPHRTKPAARACPPAWRWAAAIILVLMAGTGEGIDLSHWARHMLRHDDWTSVDFRDPVFGMFLAARAGTDDPQTKATLAFTAAPKQECVPDVTIAINVGQPAFTGSEELARVAVQLDGTAPRYLKARIVSPQNDVFVFVELLDELDPNLLRSHRRMVVTTPDGERLTFSLKGFDRAWETAQAVCLSFMPPESN
jgi:hypothetical protein